MFVYFWECLCFFLDSSLPLPLVDGFERADIGAEIQCTLSEENGGITLEDHIYQLCQKLLLMLKSYRHAPDVIKATTELLSTLLNFSYDQGMMNSCCITWRCGLPPPPHSPGPACCFLETPNVRILGAIAQSDVAKTDVGTMKACYTAYLRALECKCG